MVAIREEEREKGHSKISARVKRGLGQHIKVGSSRRAPISGFRM